MAETNIHAIWRLTPSISKETGKIVEEGLFSAISPAGAARELKKRCNAEIKYADRPLAGCAIYTQLIMHWAGVCLNSAEPGIRNVSESFMKAAGEKEIVDLIERTWERYEGYEEIPEDIKYDILDEIREILKDRYGDIAYDPGHLSPADIRKSKELALMIGKRKRPKKPAEEIAETTQEKEKSPEKSQEKPDIRAEIEEKIKKAR